MRLLIAGVAALLALVAPASAQTFPKFTGLVVDAANVLPPETEARLTAKLDALQRDTKRQLVVATIPDTQGYPIEDYGYRLGRAWGVGLKDADNGAILFIAPGNPQGQRGPRIEVGYGLEPILTDAFSSQVINQQMMPRLRQNDVAGALTAGTDALVAQLRASPEEQQAKVDAAVKQFDAGRRRAPDGGGVPFALIFWVVVFLFVVVPMIRGRRGRRGPWEKRRRGGGDWPIVLWSIANEIGRESSRRGGGGFGGWSSGGGGSGWGGGGFSGGGGGSFGGGGASGSW